MLSEAQAITSKIDLNRISEWRDANNTKFGACGEAEFLEPEELLCAVLTAYDSGALTRF
jgi:hypothetical protein